MLKIRLSKPGGQPEGPFSLEQINRDLAVKRYTDTDYWAWYEGMTEWVPLHSVPGIISARRAPEPAMAGAEAEPAMGARAAQPFPQQPALAVSAEPAAAATATAETEALPSLAEQLSSGLPFSALERIFIFTTGDGPTASRSPVTARMLEATTGETLDQIRREVPRDALTHCSFLEALRGGGTLPDAAWRAIAGLDLLLVQQAREGLYRICIRSYPIETNDFAALALFYNKAKL